MLEEDKIKLKEQAKVSSQTTIFVSKKRIHKEGHKIFDRIGEEVCLIISYSSFYT